MKTTVEIADPLFHEAKREAARRGVTLRALIEEGLRRVIDQPVVDRRPIRDRSYGQGGPTRAWADASWEERLGVIYEGRT